jgi:hypothetical protein
MKRSLYFFGTESTGKSLVPNNMKLIIVVREIFYFLTISLLVFFAMELIKPRMVLAYVNLNWLLLFWLLTGIAVLFLSREEK